jgi:hypothetical protein
LERKGPQCEDEKVKRLLRQRGVESLHSPYKLLGFCHLCQVQCKNKQGMKAHERGQLLLSFSSPILRRNWQATESLAGWKGPDFCQIRKVDRLEAAEYAKERARDDEPGPITHGW